MAHQMRREASVSLESLKLTTRPNDACTRNARRVSANVCFPWHPTRCEPSYRSKATATSTRSMTTRVTRATRTRTAHLVDRPRNTAFPEPPRIHAIVSQAASLAEKAVRSGHSVDVGIAQVNSGNFKTYGVTAAQMLDPCDNLKVGGKNPRGGIRTIDVALSRRTCGTLARDYGLQLEACTLAKATSGP